MDPQVREVLESGRGALREAPDLYGRPFGPEDYWWMGTVLAAAVLAELSGQSGPVDRLQSLADRIGLRGPRDTVVEEVIDELALLDALGLLWPLYERRDGRWQRTEAPLAPGFGPEDAYWLALGHLATARLTEAGQQDRVAPLAGVLADLVTGGLRPEHEAAILAALSPGDPAP
ncbi:hypothetical protein [Caldinitratiruptor microaerophilus]|uniref:Uncharacterized protein n=1 Tax=Caldinitratiruptor microaerophilus TaxID=671077 RepID=A0AA35CLF5_9FIRM|nr:hypothetical protein [Caldinitratiruptor microaerophilus]BDG61484.1 hypothetical protein caldi_25740 [Caldinitratiruptor microaerophilus]